MTWTSWFGHMGFSLTYMGVGVYALVSFWGSLPRKSGGWVLAWGVTFIGTMATLAGLAALAAGAIV